MLARVPTTAAESLRNAARSVPGLAPGDRVMIRMGNEADYVLVHFGALAAGLISLPSSPQLTESEAAFLMENSGAAALVVGSGCTVAPEALGDRLLLDTAAI